MPRKPDLAKRAQILEKAVEVVRERGVHRATMSDIADAVPIKRSSLYWYFKDLGEIFDALLDDLLNRQEAFVAERTAGITHPVELLDARLRAVHAFYDGREDLIVILFQFWALTSPDAPTRVIERIRDRFAGWRNAALAWLRAGMEAGLVARCDPEALFDTYCAIVDGLLVHRVSRGIDPTRVADLVRDLLLQPLVRHPKDAHP